MVPVFAYATGIEPFLNDAVLDREFAARFPGASVWPAAREIAVSRGWDFETGDVVLERIRTGQVQAGDVRVIQEENAALGTALIRAGARPSLLLCGESPLFAHDFYRRLNQHSEGFSHALLFRGALSEISASTQGHVLHFPGFHLGALGAVQPWKSRSDVVMVAGNKYWRHEGIPILERVKRSWQTQRHPIHFEWLRTHQLHDRRLHYVVGLYQAGLLTLFGSGWDVVHHLPTRWREELIRTDVKAEKLGPTEKHSTVGGFRLTLAIENFDYPGYVTEKIIDALAAGSIPLYWGAPDIDDFIPEDLFVNLRNFSSPKDLITYLATIDEHTGMSMINRGQEFLASKTGEVFSFEHQGELIIDIASQ